jgi:hypothetical protein
MSDTKVYTVAQLAAMLDLNERTIGDALRSNELVGYKKFGKWFVLHEDLVKYLRS